MIIWEKEEQLKANIDKNVRITKNISYIRLILGVALIVALICLFSTEDYILFGCISGALFIVFIGVVLYSNRYYTELNHDKQKEHVYFLHKKRRNLEFNALLDNGKEFKDKEDYKLSDLDIFGTKSLYQYISSAKTKLGREKLANRLKNKDCKDNISQSVIELGNNEDSNSIEAKLLEFDNKTRNINYDEINHLVDSKIKISPLYILIDIAIYIALYVYLIVALVNSYNLAPVVCLFIVAFFFPRIMFSNEIFNIDAINYEKVINSYYATAEEITKFNFEDTRLNQIKNTCQDNLINLNKYKNCLMALALRKNIFINLIGNGLFGYDMFTILIFNNLSKTISSLNELFNAVADMEVSLSFANIIKDNEVYTKCQESMIIEAKEMYHPLVKNCIPNDFTLKGGIVLTGSNMSGKTTFMRTLAINQLLKNACGICTASSFKSLNLNIVTSLRANDMLSEGISTFYAEILRMKAINTHIKSEPCFVLVDEIFKGTNAKDRIDASMKVIDKLNLYNTFFIVSTHDPELCDAKNILNYHFNEHYVDEQIQFDYKIKEGKATTSNAIYLLKMSGIIED